MCRAFTQEATARDAPNASWCESWASRAPPGAPGRLWGWPPFGARSARGRLCGAARSSSPERLWRPRLLGAGARVAAGCRAPRSLPHGAETLRARPFGSAGHRAEASAAGRRKWPPGESGEPLFFSVCRRESGILDQGVRGKLAVKLVGVIAATPGRK